MKKAILVYTDYLSLKNVTLETGGLDYIDSYTRNYKDIDELKASYINELKIKNISGDIDNSDIKLYCIKDVSLKEELPLLLNDKNNIILYNDYYNNNKSQVEISRKLLFNSKNKVYLKSFLNSDILQKTALFSVNISNTEYQFALKKGLNVINRDGKYYISVVELLKYASTSDKLGLLREAFEDSLDFWKNRMMALDVDELYYYSRNLRVLQNDYYNSIQTNTKIKNLDLRNDNLITYLNAQVDASNKSSVHDGIKIIKKII